MNDLLWMKVAVLVSQQSKDPSTKVGSVIVNQDGFMVGAGYNHFAKGLMDSPELYLDRNEKYPRTVHAEMDAILHAAEKLEGCNLYTTRFPCDHCAAHIIEVGIANVITVMDTEYLKRWQASVDISTKLFKEAGVKTYILPNGMPDV